MKRIGVNSQNQLVRESIFTALMILMEKKSFSEITITEIVNKAGVSRMSYYRNYNSKEDIINIYLDEMFEEYMEIISNYEEYDRYHRKYWFIACFKNDERLIRNLVNSGLTFLVLERINQFVDKVIELPSVDKVIELPSNEKKHLPETEQQNIRFAVGGLFNVIIEWFNGGMSESLEEMAGRSNVTAIHNIGTDGMVEALGSKIKNASEQNFDKRLKYHISTCEEPSILGASLHGLYIGKKQ